MAPPKELPAGALERLEAKVDTLLTEVFRLQVIILKLRGVALGQLQPVPAPLNKKGQ